jgi:MFS family permease
MTFTAQAVLAAAMVAGPTEVLAKFHDTALYQRGYLLFSIAGLCASACCHRCISYFGARSTSTACLLLFIVSEAVLDRWRSPFDFCVGFGGMGVAQGGFLPAMQFILSARVAKERMGTANGVNDAAGALGRVLAPLCIGYLYRSGLAWRVSSMLPASALPLLLAVPRDDSGGSGGRDPLVAQETHELPLGEPVSPPRKYRAVPQSEDSMPLSIDSNSFLVHQFDSSSPNSLMLKV